MRIQPELLQRAKKFALRIIKLYASLPKSTEAQVIGRQLLRCGTSVGAQLAEASHAKSRLDFISKIEGALQEAEETKYWLELLVESSISAPEGLESVRKECDELIAILTTIAAKSRDNI
jgi:four helix bundle protein